MEGLHIYKEVMPAPLQSWAAAQVRRDLNFVRPVHKSGNPMNVHMAFYGRVWDPGDYSYYDEHEVLESAELPVWLTALGQSYAKRSGLGVPDFDTAIVNWYTSSSALGIHQSTDEEQALLEAGSPVVVINIGSDANLLHGMTREVAKQQSIDTSSGDVIVFGGPARSMYHGLNNVNPDKCPDFLEFKNPGLLTITLKQTKLGTDTSDSEESA